MFESTLESIKNLYTNIFDGIKKIFVFKKSTIVETMKTELEYIDDELIPMLSSTVNGIDSGAIDLKVIDNDKLLKRVRGLLITDPKSNANLLNMILRTCENINDYAMKLEQLVNKNMPATITDKTVTVKELAIMKVINDVILFRGYTYDLLYCVLASLDSQRSVFQKTITRLSDTAILYAKAIDNLSAKNLEKLLKTVTDIPSNTVTEVIASQGTVAEEEVKKSFNGHNLLSTFLGSGFVGNPIYHIGMYLEDKKFERNERRKNQKQAIELIIIDLRKQQNGEFDNKIAEQIKYYENKIAALDYKIEKYANS